MSKNALIVMMGVAVLVALVAVFLAMDDKGKKSGGTPSAAAGEVKPATAPPVAEKPPTLKAQIEDFSAQVWRPISNGMETEVTKDEIRIHGTTQFTDWGHENGIGMSATIPDGNFTASVDIKIAKFDGDTGYKNPYIRVQARNRSAIGIYANPAAFYQMHDWKTPTQTHSTTHKLFGDEATTFHRLSLKWEEATGTATATVDGEPIGSFQTQLGPARKISLFVNTPTKGCDVDVLFRNLKVEIPASPDETP